MEAATTQRQLSGEKAQRIVDAMRTSVGARGVAGATFDHVAREAGVSGGLLHYHFGNKERLPPEAVGHHYAVRPGVVDGRLAAAGTADEGVHAPLAEIEELVWEEPEFFTLV